MYNNARKQGNRDFTNILKFGKIAHSLQRYIKAINLDTNEICCFVSKSQCSKYLGGISPAMVYLIAENKAKIGNTDKGKYTFEYTEEKDLINLIKLPHGKLGKSHKNII